MGDELAVDAALSLARVGLDTQRLAIQQLVSMRRGFATEALHGYLLQRKYRTTYFNHFATSQKFAAFSVFAMSTHEASVQTWTA